MTVFFNQDQNTLQEYVSVIDKDLRVIVNVYNLISNSTLFKIDIIKCI